jgi:protein required for attachment to host cells
LEASFYKLVPPALPLQEPSDSSLVEQARISEALKMEITWIIVADQTRLRVFEIAGGTVNLYEIVDFLSPEGRMRVQVPLENVQQGSFENGEPVSTGTDEASKSSARCGQSDLFSKQISSYVERARLGRRFTKLRIIAPLDFLGLLRKNMSEAVTQSIEDEVVHNLVNFEKTSIEKFLNSIHMDSVNLTRRGQQPAYRSEPRAPL